MSSSSRLSASQKEGVQYSSTPSFLGPEWLDNAVPIPGDNVETHFQGFPLLPPLDPTSPGSSQGHYENYYDYQPKTPQQQVQYDPTDIAIKNYNPKYTSSQSAKVSNIKSIKKYTCSEFFYESEHTYKLNRHMKTHTGDRSLFCCPKCPNTYSTKYNLKRHVNKCEG
ncbi:C2H2-type zinc finger transcription factor [Phycomyces blakesleeanus]|uniref:C2H2-type zinc finger transcription factor n=2 Tax=Phycomyces blakesleeanus TaxID=4837 RepID=A0A163BGP3_PHYB8|nr:C2H2-type zinc finger transcription factor [Phycomyces blakesleeanus NRRL 1555(-)]OAD81471.1 C2H2-type zinc finger transcription factor [Phycomyces blakesleeanus NRRL 1555(-)]|eukprot:XP_018299511.1 C2H2-type zinc finger transcription factor [Phycomyces blakesleeanus NRRL 1555(-)]